MQNLILLKYKRRVLARLGGTFVLLAALAGCASSLGSWVPTQVGGGWIAGYDTAERRADETGRELLIVYRDPESHDDAALSAALHHSNVKENLNRYVRCMLFKTHEPDRRYVTQFGVDRAPALIVVHRDGTYHARSGRMDRADVVDFLGGAEAPGEVPQYNPYLPRRAKYDWHDSLDQAKAISRETRQPVLVVCYRQLSSDWHRMRQLLSRHEVYRRLGDMIHCRLDFLNFFAESQDTPFGELRLPALVIVQPDGAYNVLEVPDSYETVVRFADDVRRQYETTTASLDGLSP